MSQLDLSLERRAELLNEALGPLLKEGWLIQSQTQTRAQLTRKDDKDGCIIVLAFLFFILPGILYLLIPAKERILIVEVDGEGQVHQERIT